MESQDLPQSWTDYERKALSGLIVKPDSAIAANDEEIADAIEEAGIRYHSDADRSWVVAQDDFGGESLNRRT
jgi:hypothetical protein